ncbi:selenide, water dikinase SelD [Jannaschia sp. W003]|uniref:selenide, water dikinase SelD n=1 Tax=Jannaschia sp. W003 TaxID=2867012 RepID=UPI0021A6D684|nr:selenide, water dikinase SelD [Jannaschia sp. W003]UWQ20170.1 selenide, water dikinase SelD [Jannaschia sp. W003]
MHGDVPLTRDLLLIGGGHAHALVLRRWGMAPQPGVRVTVVNPGPTAPYTGMLPGHVAGHYARGDLDIDLVRLARVAGARLIDGAVDRIEAGRAHVAGRGWIAFDVASLDVGITGEMTDLEGFAEHAVGAKPLGRFAEAWRAHRDAARSGARAGDAAVIGGGVAGVELAMAMTHALPGARITVLEAEAALTGVADRARRCLLAAMKDLGVTLRTNARVERVEAERVVLADGAVPSRFTVGAGGARPHGWLAASGLPSHEGFVRVGPTLQVEGHPNLFAVGDCAHLDHAPRPKAGVFAVRAAPVLERNLRAVLAGETLPARFRPQRRYLKLVSLGGRRALAERGGWSPPLPERLTWWWKDRIDRRFMEKLTDLPAMPAPPVPRGAAAGVSEALGGKPLCGGCGSKVGPGALGRALADLPPPTRSDVLSRPGDDAAVLVHGERSQVLTTDHLRAFTLDHALMARIAAVHALGDVWAMGAEPQAALAQLVLPRITDALAERTLREMLAAASEVIRGAGAELVGGHTTMGAEMTVGFSITGLAGRAIGHDGARAGDALVLTKPLGTGVILAGEMAGRAPGAAVTACLAAMARPQGEAAAILGGAHAMTDVTGFGLAGHLLRICEASGVGAEIAVDALPLYGGAAALAEAGVASTIHGANVAAAPVMGRGGWMLHDPQTAGGLLAAVPEDEADALVERLRAAGFVAAARIGQVVEGPAVLRGM